MAQENSSAEAKDSSADPITSSSNSAVERALEIVRTMVHADGCAWHGVQTHESLTKFLIEESYELVDAVEQGPVSEVRNELGDVLYQVMFHSVIAERDGEGYDFDAVAETLSEKLIARHPHVFGDRGYLSVEELHSEWEQLKETAEGQERGSRAPLDGVPAGMPPLARAAKVVERLKRARLATPSGPPISEAELGDALLGLVVQANANDLDPDRALRLATQRFIDERSEARSPEAPFT